VRVSEVLEPPSPARPDLPRLGPRTWWVYLALAQPKTLAQLAAEAGIVEDSVRKHLRKLEGAELVARTAAPGTDTRWHRIVELDTPTVYGLVGRVQRARLKRPRSDALPEYPRPFPVVAVTLASLALLVAVAVVLLLATA
jgi:hypothetical protein